MAAYGQDTLKARRTLNVGSTKYDYYSLAAAAEKLGDVSRLPFSLKILLENLLRWEDGSTVTVDDVQAVADWLKTKSSDREIAYRPARVLMQDFTGVPAVVDPAALREALTKLGGAPRARRGESADLARSRATAAITKWLRSQHIFATF